MIFEYEENSLLYIMFAFPVLLSPFFLPPLPPPPPLGPFTIPFDALSSHVVWAPHFSRVLCEVQTEV